MYFTTFAEFAGSAKFEENAGFAKCTEFVPLAGFANLANSMKFTAFTKFAKCTKSIFANSAAWTKYWIC